ncbi:hypothetical protein ACQQCD_01570 [Pseudarthrobacter sp. J1763]|uniref:hypothetical protein n=1 Tax=Pseudarthrobacter sp. J1763 TaxID=3420445 RepID=UPI003D2B11F9
MQQCSASVERFKHRLLLALGRDAHGRATAANQAGNAIVEFTFLSVLLMVPVVYFILTVAQLQAASFAAVGATDQAAKVYVAQANPADGRVAAQQAAMLALADHGFGQEAGSMSITCAPGSCSDSGSIVTVSLDLSVPLPLMPFDNGNRLNVGKVSSSASQIVGRFR